METPTPNAAGKFQVTKNPSLPGVCASCGRTANNQLQYVDWGQSLDYYGAVLFCFDCAVEMGLTVGLVLAADLSEALLEIANLHEQLEATKDERNKYYAALDSLVDIRNLFNPTDQIERPRTAVDEESDSESPDSESGTVEPTSIFT